MTPMLERLARRLAEWRGCEPWERLDDEVREYQAGIVRALLQELREPDEAMLGAACRELTRGLLPSALKFAWQAGIDAALGDSP
ncbi:MAG TPA: hypothetical protein VD994_09510 [Prosthecobacter sp.]|nr:hypothetical protein [Prosthecobacter sp.]